MEVQVIPLTYDDVDEAPGSDNIVHGTTVTPRREVVWEQRGTLFHRDRNIGDVRLFFHC